MANNETRWARGSRTFGQTVRPRGGKRTARQSRLYEEATQRLVRLFEKGDDKLSSKPVPVKDRGAKKTLERQRRFARMSLPERIVFINNTIDRLKRELAAVEKLASQRTRALKMPTILIQIDEAEQHLSELFQELNDAPRVISRRTGDVSVIDPDDSELTPEQYAALVDEQQEQYNQED